MFPFNFRLYSLKKERVLDTDEVEGQYIGMIKDYDVDTPRTFQLVLSDKDYEKREKGYPFSYDLSDDYDTTWFYKKECLLEITTGFLTTDNKPIYENDMIEIEESHLDYNRTKFLVKWNSYWKEWEAADFDCKFVEELGKIIRKSTKVTIIGRANAEQAVREVE